VFTRGNAKHCFVRALRAATLRTRDLNYLRLVSGLYRGAPRYPLSGWKARQDKTKVGERNALLLNETKLLVPNRGRYSFNGRRLLAFWAEKSTNGKNVCGFSCGVQYIINASKCLIPFFRHNNVLRNNRGGDLVNFFLFVFRHIVINLTLNKSVGNRFFLTSVI
jgi:hypothetical protein